MTDGLDVRPSPIAGTWYSGDPVHLAQEVDEFIATASIPEFEGDVVGIIAPHAGYRYSGKTAGHAFRCVQGFDPDVVVVLSPYHAGSSRAVLTSDHQAYKTP